MKFEDRKRALLQLDKTNKRILPFVTQYHPGVTNLKEILMKKQCSFNTATTTAKRNFQGTTHTCNILQKGAFTERHTRESKYITEGSYN